MERMKKEKESGTLLGVGTAYMEVHTFKGVDYITVKDFNKAINHLQIEIGGLMGERDGKQMRIDELEEENKKLKSDLAYERTMLDNVRAEYKSLQNVIKKLKAELSKNKVERWSLKKDCENKIEQQKIALKSMENQIRELKETLYHRDSFFSIMRDVLENEKLKFDFYELREILYCVVHEECGDYDLSEKELEVVKKFWDREYV